MVLDYVLCVRTRHLTIWSRIQLSVQVSIRCDRSPYVHILQPGPEGAECEQGKQTFRSVLNGRSDAFPWGAWPRDAAVTRTSKQAGKALH